MRNHTPEANMPDSTTELPEAIRQVFEAHLKQRDAAAVARFTATQIGDRIPAAQQELAKAEKALAELQGQFDRYTAVADTAGKSATHFLEMATSQCERLGLTAPELPPEPPLSAQTTSAADAFYQVGNMRIHMREIFVDRERTGWHWLGATVEGLHGGEVPLMHRVNDESVNMALDFLQESYGPLTQLPPSPNGAQPLVDMSDPALDGPPPGAASFRGGE